MAKKRKKKRATEAPSFPGFDDLPGLTVHPLFPSLKPFIHVEVYDRDGGHKHPRFRFEIKTETPSDIERAMVELEIGCARCGASIRPFRRRRPNGRSLGRLYLAVACPHAVDQGCARSPRAAAEYTAIAGALGHKR